MLQGGRNARGGVPVERTHSNSDLDPRPSNARHRRGAPRNQRRRHEGATNAAPANNQESRGEQQGLGPRERPAALNHAQTYPTTRTQNHSGDSLGENSNDGNSISGSDTAFIGNVDGNRDNTSVQIIHTTNFHRGSSNSLPIDLPTFPTQATESNPFRSLDRVPEDADGEVAEDTVPQHRNARPRSAPPYRTGDFRPGHHPLRGPWRRPNATGWEGLWDSGTPITEEVRAIIKDRVDSIFAAEFDQLYKGAAPRGRRNDQQGLAPEFLVLLGVGITLPFFTLFLAMKR